MSQTVEKALALWGLEQADWQLVAARENRVFRVCSREQSFAMRLHRRNYRTNAELWSELQWMDAIATGGVLVPAPIASQSGQRLHTVDGIQIDVLTWLSGDPLGKAGQVLAAADRNSIFWRIGREMARLHTISDAWSLPDGFTRGSWDCEGLLGDRPLWDRFWDNPTLSAEDRSLFLTIRDRAKRRLREIESVLDYGLIHADLVRENVLVAGDKVQLIDFDDAGFGFRLFDLATTLVNNMHEPDFSALQAALCAGYQSQRKIDLAALDLFIVLRAMTYVGWIIERLDEDGAEARNKRFVANARSIAERFLAAKGAIDGLKRVAQTARISLYWPM